MDPILFWRKSSKSIPQLPPTARIHPVFHVSLLKPYNGTPAVTPLDLPPLADNGVITLEPQQILDTRWIKRGDTFMEESLPPGSPRILFATSFLI
ncbi:hypothetical protein AAG906_028071 [Vitis piasezkii]